MPSLPLTHWERKRAPEFAWHVPTLARSKPSSSTTWGNWGQQRLNRLWTGYESVDSVRTEDGNSWSHIWRIIQRGPSDPLYKNFRDWDLGNNFQSKKTSYSDNLTLQNWAGRIGSTDWEWQDILCNPQHWTTNSVHNLFPTLNFETQASLDARGSTAIARSAPGNPAANATQALAELIRDVPRLPGRAIRKDGLVKGGASEYLNYVFGIKPTINDVKTLADAYIDRAKIVKQYERDHGKRIRRRYRFDPVTTVTVQDLGNVLPGPSRPGAPWHAARKCHKTTTTTRQYWFSGAFRYHLSVGDDLRHRVARDAQIAHLLYGASFTPSVVWELVPWSWLVDWVSNTGDVINNVVNFTLINQVMQYGYIMCESTHTVRYELQSSNVPFIGRNLWQEFEVRTKQRRKATPYGFGLDPSSFTGQQWAILGALGIAQGGKHV